MGQDVLTKDQEIILELVERHPRIAELFYLSGGTALAAFYFGHRYSDDLDFFTDAEPFPQLDIEVAIADFKRATHAVSVTYRRLYDRRIFFLIKGSEELKLEFTKYPFPRLAPLEHHGALRVDSLKDIAANKFMALLDRAEAKDFVDIYFLMTKGNMTLLQISDFVATKFQIRLDALTLGSELSKVRRITMLPKMIRHITLRELKDFFSAEAKQLQSSVLSDEL